MFSTAIVKKPGFSIEKGLTSANLGQPDFNLALIQHQQYINALKECGLKVMELEADEKFPDSTFIEDIALCTPYCAVVTNPGAGSRKGEKEGIEIVLKPYFENIETIKSPGTIEAGDIMMVDSHYFIGLSSRTNKEGAVQMISILKKYGLSSSTVPLKKMLHLKTGLSYLEKNNLLVCGEFINFSEFETFNKLIVPENEAYAANSVWVNDLVLVPDGYPQTTEMIQNAGYTVITIDVSEFRKLDGGLSCMSLRF